MKRIAVFGATGKTGLEFVKLALEKNLEIVAIVRNPDKLPEHIRKNDKCKIVQASIYDQNSLEEVLIDVDAVVSCLGFPLKPPMTILTDYTDSMQAIAGAMRAKNIRKLVVITSWCTIYEPGNPVFVEWIFKPLVIGRNLDDMARMEQFLLNECKTTLDVTCVRPPGLTSKPSTKSPIKAVEGQFVKDATKWQIPRADVARFMLDCCLNDEWVNKCVAISL